MNLGLTDKADPGLQNSVLHSLIITNVARRRVSRYAARGNHVSAYTPSWIFKFGSAFPRGTLWVRVRRTCISAIAVVPAKQSLSMVSLRIKRADLRIAYQANAPNAAAAFAAEHTCPKHTRSLKNTASATNPANQNSIVRTSTPRMANLW